MHIQSYLSHHSSPCGLVINYLNDHCLTQSPESVLSFVNIDELVNSISIWGDKFPNFEPYFDYHVTQDTTILRVLSSCGVKFRAYNRSDVSSLLSQGVCGRHVFLANPCKVKGLIRQCSSVGISLISVDSVLEVVKLAEAFPECNAMLLIRASDKNASVLGVSQKDWISVFRSLKENGVRLEGISLSLDATTSLDDVLAAIHTAHAAFRLAHSIGLEPRVLDLGSLAFLDRNCRDTESLEHLLTTILSGISAIFSDICALKVICDPSAILLSSSCFLATRVLACSEVYSPLFGSTGLQYQIDASIYSTFANGMRSSVASILAVDNNSCQLYSKTLAPCDVRLSFFCGSSSCSDDIPSHPRRLPSMVEGDWILWRGAGIASCPLTAEVNDAELPRAVYLLRNKEIDTTLADFVGIHGCHRHRFCSQCGDGNEETSFASLSA